MESPAGPDLFELVGQTDALRGALLGAPVFVVAGLIGGAVLGGALRGLTAAKWAEK